MKIVVTGAAGQLGAAVSRVMPRVGETIGLTRSELDVADLDRVRACLQELAPDVLVNAAAYTAVDRAEREPQLAYRVNAEAVQVMAEHMQRMGGLLVHYSTDYVFDGEKRVPYVEDDPPAPLGAYGRSKLAGELAVRECAGAHLILRTSWVYSSRGSNFLRTMLRLSAEREELRVVDDQIGAPTSADWLAEVTAELLERCQRTGGGGWNGIPPGTYHLTAAGETSWYQFAREILARAGRLSGRLKLLPIPTADYPLPAKRPAYSVLSNAKFTQTFGIYPSQWLEQLGPVMESLGFPAEPHLGHQRPPAVG